MTVINDRPRGAWTRGGREWFHVCVRAGRDTLLLNIIVDGTKGRPTGNVTLMSLGERPWASRLRSARCFAHPGGDVFGIPEAQLRFTREALEVEVRFEAHALSATLRPKGWATAPSSTHFGEGTLHWVVCPDCECFGRLVENGVTTPLESRAYVDHNWGDFRWGAGLAWSWAFAHTGPYAAVWMRMLRRDSRRELGSALLLWRDGRSAQSWVDSQLHAEFDPGFRGRPQATAPAVLGHLLPSRAVGVPQRVKLTTTLPEACLTLHAEELGRLVVPDDDTDGVTVINEVVCRASLSNASGSLGTGHGVMEVLRAG